MKCTYGCKMSADINLQTITIMQMLSSGGEGAASARVTCVSGALVSVYMTFFR